MLAKRVVKFNTFVYLSFSPSIAFKSESWMSNKKRSKELMSKMRQRRLRAITSKRARKKIPTNREEI